MTQEIDADVLLNSCVGQFETQVCSKEVYEPSLDHCDSVISSKTTFLADEFNVGAVRYSLDVIETTPLKCCLSAEDYPDNPLACIEDTQEYDEYEFEPEG